VRETAVVVFAKAPRAASLPRWYDVDTVEDLRRLAAELRTPRGARCGRDAC
jgi:hypothetical protein